MNEFEAMLRAAPTTEDGGEFVLFEGSRDEFVGQFMTADETLACIKEKHLKRPTLLMLSMLKPWQPVYIPYEQ